ncbi:MAG: DUF4332 domain-containing protein [Chloroflexi bacterium]|nr:DUF4332 domain-containing protein [Chloroflexota bacterium]
MFQDFQFSGLVLCYGPLAFVILGFIGFAFLTDKNARRTYLRIPERGKQGSEQQEVVAQTPAGLVVKLTPTAAAAPIAAKPDDLQRIEGVGPKISQVLAAAGIRTYADVATKSADELKVVLDAAGITGITDPTSWPQQARLLLRGDYAALEVLQNQLRGGKYQ